MNKLTSKSFQKIKTDIRNRYLAGESVRSIATSYDVIPRNIYFHLGELSADDKGLHAKNQSLQMTFRKAKRRKEEHAIQESRANGSKNSLADFES